MKIFKQKQIKAETPDKLQAGAGIFLSNQNKSSTDQIVNIVFIKYLRKFKHLLVFVNLQGSSASRGSLKNDSTKRSGKYC